MRSSELFVDFDTALRGLVEREKAQLHKREIVRLIALHRGAGQYVVVGAHGALLRQRRPDALLACVLLACVLGPAGFGRGHEGDPSAPAWDEDGRFVIVESAESEEVGAVWELIRQLAAAVDITLPRPPRVTLEVTIPARLLAGSDRATAGTAGPVCARCDTMQSGTTQSGAAAPMRRRVKQRGGICRYPGCVRAAVYTELDDVEEFDPGHTADANLIA